MKEFANSIRTLTTQLATLALALEGKAASSSADQELAATLTLELLEEFKNSLDHARHLVWPYVIALQQGSPENVDFALQQYRMQRVREMILSIRKDEEFLRSDAKTRLFMAEMNRMTNVRDIA